jgi:lipopolysaccharide assembly protein B
LPSRARRPGMFGALNTQLGPGLDLGFAELNPSLGVALLWRCCWLGVLVGGLVRWRRRGLPLRPGCARRARCQANAARRRPTPRMTAFVSEWFWFFLLLPLAALSGWVRRRGGERHSDTQVSRLSTTYFRGLNYLLNEQPDKAIEVFLQIAEVDKDTFETQVALGHLFRRRGEVDRAIRLHQGLVAAPGAERPAEGAGAAGAGRGLHARGPARSRRDPVHRPGRSSTHRARRRCAPDRHLPGRARLGQGDRGTPALRGGHRRTDGQAGRAVRVRTGRAIAPAGEVDAARAALARAYEADANCVRAGHLEGRIEVEPATTLAAIRAFERVARHDPDYLPELLPALLACYERRATNPARARSWAR